MAGAARTAQTAGWRRSAVRRTTEASSLSTFTFTGLNSADYTTSYAQFGAGSLDLVSAGNDRQIEYANWSGPFPSGTGDFCIEGWVYIPAARSGSAQGDPIVNNETGGLCVRFGDGAASFNALSLFARGQADLDYANITWPRDQWVHWAVQRKNATISFWADGNKLSISGGSGGGARNFTAPTTAMLTIGGYEGGGIDQTMRSYLDEICVSNSWRYDDRYSTYTVPTASFTVDTLTDMLIHFDSNLTTAGT